MVTAILIPIIFIYFYWLTRKEMKESYEKWTQLDHILEEAVVSGTIQHIKTEKQRYYYHRFVYVTVLTLQIDRNVLQVKKIEPLRHNFSPNTFTIGEHVRLYGNWKEDFFQFNRVERTN
ncbi:hypothetical protein LS684_07555 [Cytobacillus spongiae]|uniref:hypothetical protein n=1 Tax=Cytobacillus spongiae TaxID=2901381 RepID=UPI001F3164DA|nr:hypothetical protein [Cytobacillus spongiae]UII57286.1 hypothetical protein LS684_07555 [Cytobacillus spongiae]